MDTCPETWIDPKSAAKLLGEDPVSRRCACVYHEVLMSVVASELYLFQLAFIDHGDLVARHLRLLLVWPKRNKLQTAITWQKLRVFLETLS